MPRGSKTCPSCGKANGPRVKLCECGHEFAIKDKPTIVKETKPIAKPAPIYEDDSAHTGKAGMHHILVPAGKCPFQFKSEEEIPEWVKKIRAFGAEKGQTYAPEALTYWAATFINRFSADGKALIDLVKNSA